LWLSWCIIHKAEGIILALIEITLVLLSIWLLVHLRKGILILIAILLHCTTCIIVHGHTAK